MKTIRTLLSLCLLSLLFAPTALPQDKADQPVMPGPSITYQPKFPIAIPAGEYDLTTTIIDFPPGAGLPKHVHGGHVLATVLSGELTLREKGTERIMRTGDSWTEYPGAEHSVVNAGAANVRVAVTMLLPKGKEPTTRIK